jgi:hypothetical protein
LFETATLHDTTSFLRVLTVGFEFRNPNIRGTGLQFPSRHNSKNVAPVCRRTMEEHRLY